MNTSSNFIFVGPRLRAARESRGLTQSALGELVEVSKQAISQFESGGASPTISTRERLAVILRVPTAFFSLPVERDPLVGPLLFRARAAGDTRDVRMQASGKAKQAAHIWKYADYWVELPRFSKPALLLPSSPLLIDDAEIEKSAAQLRKWWGLGLGPIDQITTLIESKGIVCLHDELAEVDRDAFAVTVDDIDFIFIGRSVSSAGPRTRFSIAHELGHLLLHRSVEDASLRRQDLLYRQLESQAHRFAGAFLLPEESFANDVTIGSLDEFLSLKSKWKVSIAAMIYRSKDLNLISDQQAASLWKQRTRRRWRTVEPLDGELPLAGPSILRKSFETVMRDGGIPSDQIVREVCLFPGEIEALANLPANFLTRSVPTPRLRIVR